MFQLADRYDSKRSGYRSKLTRLYVYRWFGETGTLGLRARRPRRLAAARADAVREVRQAPPEVASAPRGAGQPLLGHADPPDLRHAQGHGGGRGGRRAAQRGPAGHRAVRARRGPARAWRPRSSCPSGTMCNEIAFRLHIRPGGDEAILHRTSHPIIAEAGGPAAFAGAMMQPLDTPQGHVHRPTTCAARCATRTATRRARGSCPSSRRRTWPAGACGRSSSCAASSTWRRRPGCACTWTARG